MSEKMVNQGSAIYNLHNQTHWTPYKQFYLSFPMTNTIYILSHFIPIILNKNELKHASHTIINQFSLMPYTLLRCQ